MDKVTENDMIHASTLLAYDVLPHDRLIFDGAKRIVVKIDKGDGFVMITFREGDGMIVSPNHVFYTV